MSPDILFEDVLMKIVLFVVVQALVYLILSKSSNIFSDDKKMRSLSFKPARSVSIRRMLAAISDLPQGSEPSPMASAARSPSAQEYPILEENQS
ncbi:hypothetical protein SLE2022_007490 [Rubroshorea leprosula]